MEGRGAVSSISAIARKRGKKKLSPRNTCYSSRGFSQHRKNLWDEGGGEKVF